MPENHNNIRCVRSISPISLGTTGTGKTGTIVDRSGFGAVEFEFAYGAVTATGATVAVTVFEGDVTGTMTSIADADLISTELIAGLAAQATARTSGVGKNVTKRLGYKGMKRYVQAKMVPTATAGIVAGANVILSKPRKAPTAA